MFLNSCLKFWHMFCFLLIKNLFFYFLLHNFFFFLVDEFSDIDRLNVKLDNLPNIFNRSFYLAHNGKRILWTSKKRILSSLPWLWKMFWTFCFYSWNCRSSLTTTEACGSDSWWWSETIQLKCDVNYKDVSLGNSCLFFVFSFYST